MLQQVGKSAGSARGKHSFAYVVGSLSVVLLLLGVFALLTLKIQTVAKAFRSSVLFLVELQDEAVEQDVKELRLWLENAPFVKEGSLVYVSKDEAAQILTEDLGDVTEVYGSNPLFNVYEFNLEAEYSSPDSVQEVVQRIKSRHIVNDVSYEEVIVRNLEKNIRIFSVFVLLVGCCFILVAVSLVHGSVRLALYYNRFLIFQMQLVGASWARIGRPYLWRAVLNGVTGALLATSLLVGTLLLAEDTLTGIMALPSITELAVVSVVLLLIGVVLSVWSTHLAVRRFLRLPMSDLQR